jgi:hypothetical protein
MRYVHKVSDWPPILVFWTVLSLILTSLGHLSIFWRISSPNPSWFSSYKQHQMYLPSWNTTLSSVCFHCRRWISSLKIKCVFSSWESGRGKLGIQKFGRERVQVWGRGWSKKIYFIVFTPYLYSLSNLYLQTWARPPHTTCDDVIQSLPVRARWPNRWQWSGEKICRV